MTAGGWVALQPEVQRLVLSWGGGRDKHPNFRHSLTSDRAPPFFLECHFREHRPATERVLGQMWTLETQLLWGEFLAGRGEAPVSHPTTERKEGEGSSLPGVGGVELRL